MAREMTGFAVLALCGMAACGGSGTPVVITPFDANAARFDEIRQIGSNFLPVSNTLLPTVGSATYDAVFQITEPVTSGQMLGPVLANSSGVMTADFTAGDRLLSGQFSEFVTTNGKTLAGTVALQSTLIRGVPGNDLALLGTSEGTINGTATGTGFDTGVDMTGTFAAYFRGDNLEYFVATTSQSQPGLVTDTGRLVAERLPEAGIE